MATEAVQAGRWPLPRREVERMPPASAAVFDAGVAGAARPRRTARRNDAARRFRGLREPTTEAEALEAQRAYSRRLSNRTARSCGL